MKIVSINLNMETLEQKAIKNLIDISDTISISSENFQNIEIERWGDKEQAIKYYSIKPQSKKSYNRATSISQRRKVSTYAFNNSLRALGEQNYLSPNITTFLLPECKDSRLPLKNTNLFFNRNIKPDKYLAPIRFAKPLLRKGLVFKGKENIFE